MLGAVTVPPPMHIDSHRIHLRHCKPSFVHYLRDIVANGAPSASHAVCEEVLSDAR